MPPHRHPIRAIYIATIEVMQKIKELRADGASVPEIMRRTKLSKASVYGAFNAEQPKGPSPGPFLFRIGI
jgi:hypothetical protein